MVKVTKDEIQDAGNILTLIKSSLRAVQGIMGGRVAEGGADRTPGDDELCASLVQLREVEATLETFVLKAKDLRHAKTYR